MRTASFITLGVGFAALQACASTPGARPQDQAAGVAEAQAQTTPNATGRSPADVDLYRAEHKGRLPPGPTSTGR